MKNLLNKLFYKLGYSPTNKKADILYELYLESIRRHGEVLTYSGDFTEQIKIAVKSIYNL